MERHGAMSDTGCTAEVPGVARQRRHPRDTRLPRQLRLALGHGGLDGRGVDVIEVNVNENENENENTVLDFGTKAQAWDACADAGHSSKGTSTRVCNTFPPFCASMVTCTPGAVTMLGQNRGSSRSAGQEIACVSYAHPLTCMRALAMQTIYRRWGLVLGDGDGVCGMPPPPRPDVMTDACSIN